MLIIYLTNINVKNDDLKKKKRIFKIRQKRELNKIAFYNDDSIWIYNQYDWNIYRIEKIFEISIINWFMMRLNHTIKHIFNLN